MTSKGKGGDIFYDPYYYQYYYGKGMSKSKKKGGKMAHSSSKKHHNSGHKYYYGKSGMKSSKSRKLKKMSSKKHLHYYYSSPGDDYWYAKGKGKGKGVFDRVEEDDDGYNDLPICPPPRPRPPTGPGSRKSVRPPATSPTVEDDDQVHLKLPQPTFAPTNKLSNPTGPVTSPSQAQNQESQQNPATGRSDEDPASPPKEPVVSSWGDDEGDGGQRVRAVLFAGAGVAAGLIAIIATYIYRREKQYVAKELSLHQHHARSPTRRLGALPRQPHVPLAHTMSATVATESEVAALRA